MKALEEHDIKNLNGVQLVGLLSEMPDAILNGCVDAPSADTELNGRSIAIDCPDNDKARAATTTDIVK